MSQDESFEIRQNKKELTSLHSKPNNIEIDAIKTIEAYDKAFAEKGVSATSKRDYPRKDNAYRTVQRLLQYDSIVQKDKGIKKKIDSMVVQPVTIDGIKKYALYYNGVYMGFDAWDNEIHCVFASGYHWCPRMQFTSSDSAHHFDPATGERRGSYKAVGKIIVHDIFIPEAPKERKKWLDNFIKEKDLDITNTRFYYRQANPDNHHGTTHSGISYDNLCNLTFDQLNDLSTKTYYRDDSGRLKDKDGIIVSYDPSTNKLEKTDIR
jgi:hypothetical protein